MGDKTVDIKQLIGLTASNTENYLTIINQAVRLNKNDFISAFKQANLTKDEIFNLKNDLCEHIKTTLRLPLDFVSSTHKSIEKAIKEIFTITHALVNDSTNPELYEIFGLQKMGAKGNKSNSNVSHVIDETNQIEVLKRLSDGYEQLKKEITELKNANSNLKNDIKTLKDEHERLHGVEKEYNSFKYQNLKLRVNETSLTAPKKSKITSESESLSTDIIELTQDKEDEPFTLVERERQRKTALSRQLNTNAHTASAKPTLFSSVVSRTTCESKVGSLPNETHNSFKA